MAKKNAVLSAAEAVNSGPLENEATSSLDKMLSILNLFTADRPIWSINEVLEAIDSSRSTAYRYLKALTSAGLLGAVGNGSYTLGPRIIELDGQIRKTDPLLQAADGVLGELVDATDHSAILCMLFKNSVLCIAERRARLSPGTLFSRGQSRPLFRGAMSKVILAHLPHHRLRNIFLRRLDAIEDGNLGSSWEEFRDNLARIRLDGYAQSLGEFNSGIVGIGAPVFNSEEAIIGSVGVAFSKDELRGNEIARVATAVKRAGREISSRLATSVALPPRAVG